MEDEIEKNEEQDLNYNLQKENEDNSLEITQNDIEEEDSKEEEQLINTSKNKIRYYQLLKEIRGTDKNENFKNEYLCNILLMPFNIELEKKLNILCLLTYFYQIKEKCESIYSIMNKFEKNIEYINTIDPTFYLKVFCRTAYFLHKQKNYFYAYKYIRKCKDLISKINFPNERKNTINEYFKTMKKDFEDYINNKKLFFQNKDLFNQEKGKELVNLINSIINDQNNMDIEEEFEKDNNNYLYAINLEWIYKAKMFLEPMLMNLRENILIDSSFDADSVYFSYFNEKDDSNKSMLFSSYLYPGPINNFCITSFKDHWEDLNNLDENDFIKKDLKLNEHYKLVSHKVWENLKSIFDCTNEIRRKKNNLDLVKIKFILFDRRLKLNKEHIVLTKERNIQIDQNSSIKELKNKIINCANACIKNSRNRNQKIYFYILEKVKANMLVEMVYAFGIGINIYETLYIEKLDFEDNSNLNKFFEKYNKDKHILIIELINDDIINFLVELKQINNKYKCTVCDNDINNIKEKYNCNLCNYSLFCSKKCANYSEFHRAIDKELKTLIESKFNLQELLHIKYGSIFRNRMNLGLTGLNNLGNTCYMNSVLQCLSKTEDLTKYFLLQKFLIEINSDNCSGYKGEISKQYYYLLNYMFNGQDDYISPNNLRKIFIIKAPAFSNHSQQDAHDFLVSFLDKLHEDLNRVTIKKYQELDEKKEGETDEEVSNRWWNYNKSRENSIILDLFEGQYKSTTECTDCHYKSINFDIFTTLNVPIPTEKMQYNIKFFTNNYKYNIINFKADSTIKEIILKSLNYIDKNNYMKYLRNTKTENNIFNYNATKISDEVLYNNILIIEFNKKHMMIDILKVSYNSPDNTIYKAFINNLKNSEIVLYEKEINLFNENNIDVFVYPITEIEKQNQFYITSRHDKILSYPLIISTNKTNTLKELESLINAKFQRIIHDGAKNQENTIEICYPHFRDKWGEFKIQEEKCPICEKIYEKKIKYCSLFPKIDKKMKISEFIEEKNKGRPLIFFSKSLLYDENKSLYTGMKLFFDKKNDLGIESKTSLSLYDSLASLNKGEILDEENLWFCKSCKELKSSVKKTEIYRAPLYLIIQIKRFKYRGKIIGTILGNKNDTFIEYNEILNLRDFIVGPDKDNYEYHLYGVVIHKQFMNGGHYIAYCKNFERWFQFNDREVEDIKNPIHKDAYLLFYKRENID